MLTRSDIPQPESLTPEQRFATLTSAQRRQLGQFLLKFMQLECLPNRTMLEVWYETRLTQSLSRQTISMYLIGNRRHFLTWRHIAVTCLALHVQSDMILANFDQPSRQACMSIIRRVPDPALQLTMLINGWRTVALPYLTNLKIRKFPRGEGTAIQQRWLAAGLVPSITTGKQYFVVKQHTAWKIDLAAIAIRCLGIKGETLCAELIELIEQHDPGPAS